MFDVSTGGTLNRYVSVNGQKVFPVDVSHLAVAATIRKHVEESKAQTQEAAMGQEGRYCTKCGSQNEGDANFYKKCGVKI